MDNVEIFGEGVVVEMENIQTPDNRLEVFKKYCEKTYVDKEERND